MLLESLPPEAETTPPAPMESPPLAAPSKGGAPLGNANRVTHGLRIAKAHGDWHNIENDGYTLRTALRSAVVDAHGSLSLLHDALIQSSCRHERRAALAERWLRLNGDALPLADRINLLAAVSSATDARDKAIKALELEKAAQRAADPWAALDALHAQAPQNAVASAVNQTCHSDKFVLQTCQSDKSAPPPETQEPAA